LKAIASHYGEKHWDTLVEESWQPQNSQDSYFTGESLKISYLRTIVADVKYGVDGPTRGFAMTWLRRDPRENILSLDHPFHSLLRACCERRFATTKDGFIGLVPKTTEAGDIVFALLGGQEHPK